MINKRLISGMKDEKKYILLTYFTQVIGLFFNIAMIFAFAYGLYDVIQGKARLSYLVFLLFGFLVVRFFQVRLAQYFSFLISQNIKVRLRRSLFEKVYGLGYGYTNHIPSSEVVQLAVEGIEQLDHYYGRFLPQFFYAVTAPLVLFCVLAPLDFKVAGLLLLFIPLIPIAIFMVQSLAKRVVGSYWKSYMSLSDRFLDNMQGLNVLKAYDTDALQNEKMNEEAEKFRIATMRVLSMQINNLTVMDIVAYGGAALGSLATLWAMQEGRIGFPEALIFILLVADYFLPLRQLGSFFHIAMNGVAASNRLFELLELPEVQNKGEVLEKGKVDICFKNVDFSYDGKTKVLNNLFLSFNSGELTALVGKSGCGKSTIVSLLMGIYQNFDGELTFQGKNSLDLDRDSLMRRISLVDYNSYLFAGTLRHNLSMAAPEASDETMLEALEQVLLRDFVEANGGLDMVLLERGQNLSGGQKQRLSLARALLKNADVYIFDEATSSIDGESEAVILKVIEHLKADKTVIFISHRLKSTEMADKIYLLDQGEVKETGDYQSLLEEKGLFFKMQEEQSILENYAKGVTV